MVGVPGIQPGPMENLTDCVRQLSKLHERQTIQNTEIQQRKQSGQQSIHYTIKNTIKRIGTEDGFSASNSLTSLATKILGTKKRHHTQNFLLLTMNSNNPRCHINPKTLEALCTDSLVVKEPFSSSILSPFDYAPSLQGSCLQDIGIDGILKRQ